MYIPTDDVINYPILHLCWFLAVGTFNIYVTYLKLRRKKLLLQAEQLTKLQLYLLTMTFLSEIDVILCIYSACNNSYFLLSL